MSGPIVLVGPMGAGKTTVGRLLAARTGSPFVDLDSEIERLAGMSIADMFAAQGEASFRDREASATARLTQDRRCIVAVGGGWMANAKARTAAPEAITVWLRVSPAEALDRIGSEAECRPLLQGMDPLGVLERLAAERLPAYEGATHTVDTEGLTAAAVAERITALLGLDGQPDRLSEVD